MTDTRGNTYRKAAQLNETVDGTTLAFYYAENIAAGANSVTVSDTISGGTLRFAILEYAGVATTSSLDVTAVAQGSGTAPNSGSATTTVGGDLIVGLVFTANPATFTAGSGFVIQDRVPAAPNSKLIVEDRRQPTPGLVSAAVSLGGTDSWGALLATFKPLAGDTAPPTAPASLNPSVISDSRIDLSWTAATDNVGVTSYLVERCSGAGCTTFAQVGSAAGLTFSNTGLLGSTSYSYRVRASDAAGNLSPYSNTATATTPAPPDTQAPTPPSSLAALAISETRIDLSWSASSDNVGVTGYLIEQCEGVGCGTFAQVGTSGGTAFSRLGLSNSTSYTFRVRAVDAAANASGYSPTATATTLAAPDTEAPTTPTAFTATATSSSQIDLAWNASTDNVAVTSYLIERCQGAGCSSFSQIATTAGTSYGNTGLSGSTSYTYRIRATDVAGNSSPYSTLETAVTPSVPDIQPPTAPTNLSAAAVSTSQIDLGWTASTDNVGVVSYSIERCQGAGCTTFSQVASVPGVAYSDASLVDSTTYRYRVRAADAASNLSAYSNVAAATTNTPPDTQAPTQPTNLAASAVTSTQINLTWTASTDNVGVTNYQVERCQGAGCSTFAQIGTTAVPSFTNTGLTASTIYNYRVRATDAASNLSAYSTSATATTPANAVIAFVQSNYAVPQSSPTSVSVKYSSAQTAGNLNVVVVGWNSASGHGPERHRHSGQYLREGRRPDRRSGFATQSIYYASGIAAAAANANTVVVVFSAATPFPDIRIAEYSGIASANPVDVVAAAQGSGTSSNSGSVTDHECRRSDRRREYRVVDHDRSRRIVHQPRDHAHLTATSSRTVSLRAVGSYSAVAPLTSGSWIMQMVAFKGGASAPDTTPPTAPGGLAANAWHEQQIDLTWTAATDDVAVTVYRIERCQGSGLFDVRRNRDGGRDSDDLR